MEPRIHVSNPVPVSQIARYFGLSHRAFMKAERAYQIYLIREYYLNNNN